MSKIVEAVYELGVLKLVRSFCIPELKEHEQIKLIVTISKSLAAFLFTLLIFSFLINGCGQQASSPANQAAPAKTITLSGSLGTGTITSVKSFAAATGYKVVAIDNSTGKTYAESADSSGNFSIEIPAGVSYEVSLIDSNSKYFGPVVMVGNSSSSEVVMGITPDSDTNLGSITLDTSSSKKYAKPANEPTTIANMNDIAEATSGKPMGAGNDGKTTLTGVATRSSGADLDKDGIPNVFDADEDNDGIRNGIISTPFGATVSSNTVESVFLSSNIWAMHGENIEAKDAISMWVNVIPKSGKLDEIQSVQCTDVPASIKDVATVRFSSSIGDPVNYPAESSLWKNSSYNLYKTTTLMRNQWIVSLAPRAIMNVGDIFTVRVTYASGGYQDFFISTSYVLTDWARVLEYNSTSMPSLEGSNSNPLIFSTNSLSIVFSKPEDEDGNILNGLRYSIQVGTSEASGGTYNVPASVTETPLTDPGVSYSTISATISTITAETYYITPVAESADGQRNGEQVWFKRH